MKRLDNGYFVIQGAGPSSWLWNRTEPPVDHAPFVVAAPIAYCPCRMTANLQAASFSSPPRFEDVIVPEGEPTSVDLRLGENICHSCGQVFVRADYQEHIDLRAFQHATGATPETDDE